MASTTVNSSSLYPDQSRIGDTDRHNDSLVDASSADPQLPALHDSSRDATHPHGKSADAHVPPALHGPAAQAAAFVTGTGSLSTTVATAKPTTTAPPKQAAPVPAYAAMQKLADRYDGGPGTRRNCTADQQNGARLRQSVEFALAGYPAGFRKNYADVAALSSGLAQLDKGAQQKYASRAMEALRAPLAQQRPKIEALQRDIAAEVQKVMQDPARRLAAIFNAPAGSDVLPEDAQKPLAEAYQRAVDPGADPASRDKAFQDASQIKAKLQADIASRLESHLAEQGKLRAESMQRISNFMDKAETLNGHRFELRLNSEDSDWNDKARALSAKSYPLEAMAEELVSPDGRSQQEEDTTSSAIEPSIRTPEEIRRDLLNFQDGLNTPGSDIYKRVHAMEKQAADTLTHNDQPDFHNVAAPATFSAITAKLPAPDANYAQRLAEKYADLARDNHDKNLEMVGQKPDAVEKALYGAGRFIANLMPPGLDLFANAMADAAFPGHGGLTPGQVGDIDFASMVGGLLLGGLDKVPGLKGHIPEEHVGEGTPHTGEPVEKMPAGSSAKAASPGSGSPGAGLPESSWPQASPDLIRKTLHLLEPATGAQSTRASPSHSPASGTKIGEPHFDVPEHYAGKPSGKLQADPHAPGVFRDDKGQAYIQAGDHTWPVRYDKDNGTWRVYQPNDPARYQYPVRADEKGRWQVHDDVGLKGGSPKVTEEQRQRVIELLRHPMPMTQAEIAARVGLSRRSVAAIADSAGLGGTRRARIPAEGRRRALELLRHQPPLSNVEIGALTGLSADSVGKIARVEHIDRTRPFSMTAEQRQLVTKLLQQKWSYDRIVKQLGCTRRDVARIAQELHAHHLHDHKDERQAEGRGSPTHRSPSPQPGTSTGGQTDPGGGQTRRPWSPQPSTSADWQTHPGGSEVPPSSPAHKRPRGRVPQPGASGLPQVSPRVPVRPSSPPYSPPSLALHTPRLSPQVPPRPSSPPYSPPPLALPKPQGSPGAPSQPAPSPYAPRIEPITPESIPRVPSGPGLPPEPGWDVPEDLQDLDLDPWSP